MEVVNKKLINLINKLKYDLYDRGIKNCVPDLKLISGEDICQIEPFCKGVKALWSPQTGIVDWSLVTEHYAKDVESYGGHIYLNFKVNEFHETVTNTNHPVTVCSQDKQQIKTRYVLTCGGLQSDILAKLTGCSIAPRIVPFRGEYLLLNSDKCHMVKGNIYPVPDPRLPFLGVHFTPRMDGNVWLGPNAVFAFKREGYTWTDLNLSELYNAVSYPGFIKMATKHFGFGMAEISKSIFLSKQIKDLQKFIPDITLRDVSRGPAGVRAQALDMDGNLVDDFVFDHGAGNSLLSKRVLHCRNAPSPGATSSLAIAKMIVDKIEKEFTL